MHTGLIVMAAVLCLAAVFLIVCHFNDENLTPVAKTFSSVFIGCVAVMLSIQVMLDYPEQAGHLGQRLVVVDQGEQYAGQIPRTQASAPVELPTQVIEAPRQVAAVPAVAPGVAAVAPVAASPVAAQATHEDSTLKDMALGGALGYLAGSAGRGGSVTNHTTVIHESSSYSPTPAPRYTSPSPPPAARPAPAPSPVVVAAPRPTFKSTFSMTRSGRR